MTQMSLQALLYLAALVIPVVVCVLIYRLVLWIQNRGLPDTADNFGQQPGEIAKAEPQRVVIDVRPKQSQPQRERPQKPFYHNPNEAGKYLEPRKGK